MVIASVDSPFLLPSAAFSYFLLLSATLCSNNSNNSSNNSNNSINTSSNDSSNNSSNNNNSSDNSNTIASRIPAARLAGSPLAVWGILCSLACKLSLCLKSSLNLSLSLCICFSFPFWSLKNKQKTRQNKQECRNKIFQRKAEDEGEEARAQE